MTKRLILIFAALAVSAAVMYGSYQESLRTAAMEEYQAAITHLEQQTESLLLQLEQLEQQNLESRSGQAIVLFQQPEEAVYEQAYPILRRNGFVGVIACKSAQPEGITGDQLAELQAAGWRVILCWDGTEALDTALARFETPPQLVSIPAGCYTPELEDAMEQAGIGWMVRNMEDGDLFSDGTRIQNLGGVFWNSPNILHILNETASRRAHIAICVDSGNAEGEFDPLRFEKMCTYLRQNGKKLGITDLDTILFVDEEAAAYYEQRKAYLESEIERCNQEIQSVYDLYARYGVNIPQS